MWDIFARGADSSRLSTWLSDHAAEFNHMDKPLRRFEAAAVAAMGPVLSQTYFLASGHLTTLKADTCELTLEQACESSLCPKLACRQSDLVTSL